jgi:uncharacterized SAM-binding protein YcdF (DUF218 family)
MLYPKNQGAGFLAITGAVLVLYNLLREKILRICKKGALRAIRIFITLGFCLMLATFTIFCISIAVISSNTHEGGKDAVIVLGAGLKGGYTVSLTLAERLDRAAEYYKQNPDVMIVVSGGQGEDEFVSEAFAMRQYLLSNGVKENNILLEDKSTSTRENFDFSKKVLDLHFGDKPYNSAYITNGFHCYRAGKYAKAAGLDTDVIPARTPALMLPAYCAREYLGVAHIIVFGI